MPLQLGRQVGSKPTAIKWGNSKLRQSEV